MTWLRRASACQGVVLDPLLAFKRMPSFAFSYAVAGFVQNQFLNEAWWSAMWLDGVPCIAQGFHEWPKVGERHVIDGVLCRLVEISDRWIWERELS
jgi:hypothetical protein